MAQLKVEGHDSLIRDTKHGGIVNTNKTEYEIYMRRHRIRQTQHTQIQDACREINSLKAEMYEIKSLIKELVNKNGS